MLKRRGERRAAVRQEHETLQVVAFRVGAELYGLDIASVQEIDRLQPITRVPQALSFVEGVIHMRGAIIPVVDLARRFGLEPIVADRQTRIIMPAGGRASASSSTPSPRSSRFPPSRSVRRRR
jgi:chemotaxis signal transduction protein